MYYKCKKFDDRKYLQIRGYIGDLTFHSMEHTFNSLPVKLINRLIHL